MGSDLIMNLWIMWLASELILVFISYSYALDMNKW